MGTLNVKQLGLAICVLFWALATSAEESDPSRELIRIGYTQACPHMCPGQEDPGFTVEIAQEALAEQGWPVEFVAMPWARIVFQTNAGALHATLSTGRKESPLLIYPEQPLARQDDCFYGRADDDWQPVDLASFTNRKTVVFKGWVLEDDYRKELGPTEYATRFLDFSIDPYYSDRAIQLVAMGRIDAFWMDTTMFGYYQSTQNNPLLKDIKLLGCIYDQFLYIGFSPQKPSLSHVLAKDFDRGIAILRKSGRLAAILAKYGVSDWYPVAGSDE